MNVSKNLNTLTEIEFLSIFGSIFEKSEWIASKTYQLKPFNNQEDLINKMMKIYNNCSEEKIVEIFNLHPKLAIEKKLTSFSSEEQKNAKLDTCSKGELLEFEKLNLDYERKFKFPFIIAVKDKNKNQILDSFRDRIKNNYEIEFNEAKSQVEKIALFRLNEILKS